MVRRDISRDPTVLFVVVSVLPNGLSITDAERKKNLLKCLEESASCAGIKNMLGR